MRKASAANGPHRSVGLKPASFAFDAPHPTGPWPECKMGRYPGSKITSYRRELNVYALAEPFSLRDRVEDDRAFLLALYQSTRDDLREAIPDPALFQQLVAMQFNAQETGYRHQFPMARQFVLLRSGLPIGRMVVDTQPEQLRLVDIAILPQARRSGAATAVLAALQHHAAALGTPLGLAVGRYNGPAQRLYQKCGFTPVAEDELAVQMVWKRALG